MSEKLEQFVRGVLREKYAEKFRSDHQWAWARLRNALQDPEIGARREILAALENSQIVRAIIDRLVEDKITAVFADGAIDANEIQRIFEDEPDGP